MSLGNDQATEAARAGTTAPFRVALTFDVEHPDRPTVPGVTELILEVLDRLQVHATMFIQGRWAEAYPDTAAAIAHAGHLVGNHSFYHARMPLFTPEAFATDVRSAERVLREACGVDPAPWFRCPFGTGQDDPAIISQLELLGYRNVGWDVDGYDWDVGDAPELEERIVLESVARGDGAIVLLHGWPRRTPEALPAIVARLRDAGAAFVSVDALEALPSNVPSHSPSATADRADGPAA